MATHTKRTMDALRSDGYFVHRAERWQSVPGRPGGGVRQDFGGFADLIAWKPLTRSDINRCQSGILAVQCCAASGLNAHLDKYRKDRDTRVRIRDWIRAGGRFLLYGWRKLKPRGVATPTWQPRIIELGDDLQPVPVLRGKVGSPNKTVMEDLNGLITTLMKANNPSPIKDGGVARATMPSGKRLKPIRKL